MMRVAILDDSEEDCNRLTEYLQRIQQEQNMTLQVSVYSSGMDFLEEYGEGYDFVFLDIEMPGLDGMQVASEIRTMDDMVGIIFITNMAQYAIRGYEVNAIDFMVKPVQYYNFVEKFQRAVSFASKRQEHDIILNDEEGIVRMSVSDIYYLEKDKNYLIYHTHRGKFMERGTIATAKKKLDSPSFVECISGCLVNLRYVEKIGKDNILVQKVELPLSRRMRKEFVNQFMEYVGGGC